METENETEFGEDLTRSISNPNEPSNSTAYSNVLGTPIRETVPAIEAVVVPTNLSPSKGDGTDYLSDIESSDNSLVYDDGKLVEKSPPKMCTQKETDIIEFDPVESEEEDFEEKQDVEMTFVTKVADVNLSELEAVSNDSYDLQEDSLNPNSDSKVELSSKDEKKDETVVAPGTSAEGVNLSHEHDAFVCETQKILDEISDFFQEKKSINDSSVLHPEEAAPIACDQKDSEVESLMGDEIINLLLTEKSAESLTHDSLDKTTTQDKSKEDVTLSDEEILSSLSVTGTDLKNSQPQIDEDKIEPSVLAENPLATYPENPVGDESSVAETAQSTHIELEIDLPNLEKKIVQEVKEVNTSDINEELIALSFVKEKSPTTSKKQQTLDPPAHDEAELSTLAISPETENIFEVQNEACTLFQVEIAVSSSDEAKETIEVATEREELSNSLSSEKSPKTFPPREEMETTLLEEEIEKVLPFLSGRIPSSLGENTENVLSIEQMFSPSPQCALQAGLPTLKDDLIFKGTSSLKEKNLISSDQNEEGMNVPMEVDEILETQQLEEMLSIPEQEQILKSEGQSETLVSEQEHGEALKSQVEKDATRAPNEEDTLKIGQPTEALNPEGQNETIAAKELEKALKSLGQGETLTDRGEEQSPQSQEQQEALKLKGEEDVSTARNQKDTLTTSKQAEELKPLSQKETLATKGHEEALKSLGQRDTLTVREHETPQAQKQDDVSQTQKQEKALNLQGQKDTFTALDQGDTLGTREQTVVPKPQGQMQTLTTPEQEGALQTEEQKEVLKTQGQEDTITARYKENVLKTQQHEDPLKPLEYKETLKVREQEETSEVREQENALKSHGQNETLTIRRQEEKLNTREQEDSLKPQRQNEADAAGWQEKMVDIREQGGIPKPQDQKKTITVRGQEEMLEIREQESNLKSKEQKMRITVHGQKETLKMLEEEDALKLRAQKEVVVVLDEEGTLKTRNQEHGIETVVVPRQEETPKTSQQKDAVKPPEQKESIARPEQRETPKTSEQKDAVKPPGQKQSIARSGQEETPKTSEEKDAVKPPVQKESVARPEQRETPTASEQKDAVKPPGQKQSIARSGQEETPKTSEEKDAVKPPVQKESVARPEQRETPKTSEEKDDVKPPVQKESIARPGQGEAPKTSEQKDAAKPPGKKESFAYPDQRDTPKTSEQKEAVKPPAQKESITRPGLGETPKISEQKDAVKPPGQKESIARSGLGETPKISEQKDAVKPPGQKESVTRPGLGETPKISERKDAVTPPEQKESVARPEQRETPKTSEQEGAVKPPGQKESIARPEQRETSKASEQKDAVKPPVQKESIASSGQEETPKTSEQKDAAKPPGQKESIVRPEQRETPKTSEQKDAAKPPEQKESIARPEQRGTPKTSEQKDAVKPPVQKESIVRPEQKETPKTSEQKDAAKPPGQKESIARPEQKETPKTSEQKDAAKPPGQKESIVRPEQRETPKTSEQKDAVKPLVQTESIASSGQEETPKTSEQNDAVKPPGQKESIARPDQKDTPKTSEQKDAAKPPGQKESIVRPEQKETPKTSEQKDAVKPPVQKESVARPEQRETPKTSERKDAVKPPGQKESVARPGLGETPKTSEQKDAVKPPGQKEAIARPGQRETLKTSEQRGALKPHGQKSEVAAPVQEETQKISKQEHVIKSQRQIEEVAGPEQKETPETPAQEDALKPQEQKEGVIIPTKVDDDVIILDNKQSEDDDVIEIEEDEKPSDEVDNKGRDENVGISQKLPTESEKKESNESGNSAITTKHSNKTSTDSKDLCEIPDKSTDLLEPLKDQAKSANAQAEDTANLETKEDDDDQMDTISILSDVFSDCSSVDQNEDTSTQNTTPFTQTRKDVNLKENEQKCGKEIKSINKQAPTSKEEDTDGTTVKNEDKRSCLESTSSDSSDDEHLEVFTNKECINNDCTRASKKFYRAPVFTMNYYKIVKRSRPKFVCEDCYDRTLVEFEKLCEKLLHKQPIMDYEVTTTQELVEISSSDEEQQNGDGDKMKVDKILPRKTVKLVESELESIIVKVMDSVEIRDQLSWSKQLLQKRLNTVECDNKGVTQQLHLLQKKADKINNSLYQCPKIKIRQLAPLDLNSGRTYNPESGNYVPPPGSIERPTISMNETYYAVKNKAIASWVPCKVMEEVDNKDADGVSLKMYKIKYLKTKHPMLKTLSAKHMAYFNAPKVRLPIGTRVIAYFDASALSRGKEKMLIPSAFYPGIIAEPLKQSNNHRYLIFYDDGYFQYVYHRDVRLVCQASEKVWEDVHYQSRVFIENYLTQYSINRPMVQTQKGQSMLVDYNGKWAFAKVIDVDCSLVQMFFEGHNRSEWIYRGSTRLGPVFKEAQEGKDGTNAAPKSNVNRIPRRAEPFVRYISGDDNATSKQDYPTPPPPPPPPAKTGEVRSVAKKSVSRVDNSQNSQSVQPVRHLNNSTIFVDDDNKPKGKVVYYTTKKNLPPRDYVPHICSPTCLFNLTHNLQYYSPLSKPLLSGWERQLFRQKSKKFVVYRGPCGKRLRTIEELHRYLRITENELNVDNFDYSPEINCLAEYVIETWIVQKKDISNGKEKMPIPCVNYYDSTTPPDCVYSSRRMPTEGVPLNLNPDFLVGCDCEDDCSDKSKCSCWQLTYAGAKYGMPSMPLEMVGYQYKRLFDHVPTGIYECNVRCKCRANCINRVVQEPLQSKLQVFKTSNRGWGLRCINDVPRGSFICIYAGHLLTEQKANEGGLDAGDEYFAELDYIEVAEQIKEGYESDVADYDEDEEMYNPEKDDDDDEFVAPDDSDHSKPFITRLRTRRLTKGGQDVEHDSQERQVISFEPKTSMAHPGNTASEKIAFRKLFGRDEACYIMDAKVTGNLGRYFNHSCSPNLFVQNVFVDTHDLRFPWVAFFSSTHIRAGTELTWNYNYEVGVVPGKVLYCQCGAPNCRQRLL